MTKVITQVEPAGFLLHLRPVIELTDDQLFALCQMNQELWIERTAEGDLVIMPPEGEGDEQSQHHARDVVNSVGVAGWHGRYLRLIWGLYSSQWGHARSRRRLGAALPFGGLDPGTEAKISAALSRFCGGNTLAVRPPKHGAGKNAGIHR